MTDDLIARIEAASGADRGLDWEIHLHDGLAGVGMYGDHPPYTASIDAALSLVPDGWRLSISNMCGPGWFAGLHETDGYGEGYGRAATPALALCAAALKERKARP